MQTLKSAIDELRAILDADQLAKVTDADAAPDGKWTRKQILGHLLDSAANNHHRFGRAQIEDAVVRAISKPDGYRRDGIMSGPGMSWSSGGAPTTGTFST